MGRSVIWEFQNNLDLKSLHNIVKQIKLDQFQQIWHSELTLSNKGRTNLSFKDSLDLERYFIHLSKTDSINVF